MQRTVFLAAAPRGAHMVINKGVSHDFSPFGDGHTPPHFVCPAKAAGRCLVAEICSRYLFNALDNDHPAAGGRKPVFAGCLIGIGELKAGPCGFQIPELDNHMALA